MVPPLGHTLLGERLCKCTMDERKQIDICIRDRYNQTEEKHSVWTTHDTHRRTKMKKAGRTWKGWALSMIGALAMTGLVEAEPVERRFFLPEMDGFLQPYIGDCMPYYEDGVFYIYYLKEGGDSYHHAIYLVTTTDFVTYTEVDEPVLTASDAPAQDDWVGTGSVVKVEDTYYLFYTGHTDSDAFEYGETIMLAKGTDPTSFEKVEGWEIVPDESLNQKRDFRDPQGTYDEETGEIVFTITASQDGVARILKYTLSADLSESRYDGIIFTDPIGEVYNLECSDTFQIGDTWYLTYSAQDDVLWYASSPERYGPYSEPRRLDGPLFYAAKHVEDENGSYMVGWARRSSSERDTRTVSEWAGNLVVQKIVQLPDQSLVLEPLDALVEEYQEPVPLLLEGEEVLTSSEERLYEELGTAPEAFLLKGSFTYEGEGEFGLAFDFDEGEEDYKLITLSPESQEILLQFRGGSKTPARVPMALESGTEYPFTYLQEDSVGVFYLDGVGAFTVRLYGVGEKPFYLFAEENEVTFRDLALYQR